jgi:putative two-component system response regulator
VDFSRKVESIFSVPRHLDWDILRETNSRAGSMSHFFKRYSLLIIAQTLCLALGLWLEHCFIVSLAQSERENQSQAESAGPATGTSIAGEISSIATASENAASEEMPILAIRITALLWIAAIQAVVAYLILTRNQEEAARKHQLVKNVSLQQYNELLRTRDAVIFGLAKLAESRDPDTGNHLERIAIYSTRLATALRHDPLYRSQITPSFIKLIGISSALHDIGKVGIRDSILLKPGKLDPQEWSAMQLHAAIGGKCIREIESRLGRSNFLRMARDIAFGHHEHWDGAGYPKGLAGEEIPLAARIVAIADVYDALSTKRVYKEAIPHDKCVEMIRVEAGKQFDPVLVKAFLKLEAEFCEISHGCRETAESSEIKAYCPEAMSDLTAETAIAEELASLETLLEGCEKALHTAPSNDELRINSMNRVVENDASPIEREHDNVH